MRYFFLTLALLTHIALALPSPSFDVVTSGTVDTQSINISGTDALSLFQPASATLNELSSLSTDAFGRGLLGLTNSDGLRTAAELGGAAQLNVGNAANTVAAGDDSRFLNATSIWEGGDYVGSAGLFDGSIGYVYSAEYSNIANTAGYAESANTANSATYAAEGPSGAFGSFSARSSINQGDIIKAQTITATSGTATVNTDATLTHVLLTGSLSGPLTINIPTAATFAAGNSLTFVDVSRSISATNTVTVRRTSSDTINSGTSEVILTAGAVRTFISNGSTKWKTDESIARVGAANTFAASQTFNGTANTAPNQTAASDSSIITRDLSATERLWQATRIQQLIATTFGNSGGGSAAQANNYAAAGFQVTSGTATSGYGRATLCRGVTTASGFSGAGINFSKQISLAMLFSGDTVQTTSRLRIVVGSNRGTPPAASSNALSARGFGAEIMSDSSKARIRLFAHDGSNYVTGDWCDLNSSTTISDRMIGVIISSNGAGTISLYLSSVAYTPGRLPSTPTSTLAGGPSSLPANNSFDGIDVVAVNDATGTPSSSSMICWQTVLEVK